MKVDQTVPASSAAEPTTFLKKIPLKVSYDLDLIRGIAAILVVFSHWRRFFFQELGQLYHPNFAIQGLYLVTDLGREAVLVFFVLSGYLVGGSVIRGVVRGTWSWKAYLADRGTRLYAVLIPALILGMLWDLWGTRHFGPASAYSGIGDYRDMLRVKPVSATINLKTFFGNLAFLQEISVPHLGSNSPLWSLANEFWYYITFPVLWLALAGKKAWIQRLLGVLGVGLVMVALGKSIAIYSLVWLLGALLAWRPLPRVLSHSISMRLTSLLFVALVLALHIINKNNIWQVLPLGLIAAAWMACVIAQEESPVGRFRAKASRNLSAISYTMYLVHVPLLFWLCAFVVGGGTRLTPTTSNLLRAFWVLPAVAIYVGLIWWLFERQTTDLRRTIYGLLHIPLRGP